MRAAITCLSFALSTMVACGGTDKGSGVPANKTLAEISVPDLKNLCLYYESLWSDVDIAQAECYRDAIQASPNNPSACEAAAAACIAGSDAKPDDCSEISQADIDELPACAKNISVGEFESCIVALTRLLHQLAEDSNCTDGITKIEPKIPMECSSIEEECTGLL